MVDDGRGDDSSPESAESSTPDHCAVCRTRLDRGAWHPTVGHTGPDGRYRIVRFCSADCRDGWRSAHEDLVEE